MAKTNNTPELKKFKNEIEIEQQDRLPFLKIEEGDVIEGIFSGFDDIDFRDNKGVRRVYKIETQDGLAYLPSNYQLNQKFEKISKLEDATILEIQITRLSDVKLEGGKKMASFKVLTT